jgi:hypothetical protein
MLEEPVHPLLETREPLDHAGLKGERRVERDEADERVDGDLLEVTLAP